MNQMKSIKGVRQVLEKLAEDNNFTKVPYDLSEIVDILKISWVDEIEISPKVISTDENVVFGRYKRYQLPEVYSSKDCVKIDYASSLNICERRFVIAKELCHIFLHKTNNVSSEQNGLTITEDDLEFLISALSSRGEILSVNKSPAYLCEIVAKHLACELLFPYEFRELYKNKYENNEVPDYELALLFRIPEAVVVQIMSPEYFDFSEGVMKTFNISPIEIT
ncbi:MAG: hypothetical protein COA93_07165 [Alphaproteobacteria bacterium]|nr:MAG: hypothetical protein COA93_07165 [Alphaproteobacteria bacterium]